MYNSSRYFLINGLILEQLLKKQFISIVFGILSFTSILTANPKEYMVINKEDWLLGVIKIDANFANGAFDSTFGIFIDDDTILTSHAITYAGFPNDINIKIKDESVDLIICIAKAKLVFSDKQSSLAILKITNYTDDYCNFSHKKHYHKILIDNQQIPLFHTNNTMKPKISEIPAYNSPFLINNAKYTINDEQGFPYFDTNGRFVGISSDNKIITLDTIRHFLREFNDISQARY